MGFESSGRLTGGGEESSGDALGEDAILRVGGEEVEVGRCSRDRRGVSGHELAIN